MELRTQDLPAVARLLARAFEENRERLNELDARIGDGDHGMSMARGFSALAADFQARPPGSIEAALADGGMRFNEVSGSTIGILMFSAMREAGKAAAGRETVTIADLRAMLEAAVGGIRKRGKAEPGQKTILDALVPALEALRSGIAAGSPDVDVLRQTAQAAEAGAETTRAMTPSVGRARWFAERSAGELDPGAVSGALIIRTVVDYLVGGESR